MTSTNTSAAARLCPRCQQDNRCAIALGQEASQCWCHSTRFNPQRVAEYRGLDRCLWLPEWLSFLSWILWPLAVILILAIAMYSFSTVANIIASPFNGLLAEKVEEKLTGKEVTGRETFASALASFPRSIWREVQKLSYYLIFALIVLVLSFIPLISPFSGVLWFLLGAWMLSLEYCDYAMDNRGLSFKESKRRIKARRGSTLPFGMMVMAGTMVPIVNLIIMPAAVCGGTILWVEKLEGLTSDV